MEAVVGNGKPLGVPEASLRPSSSAVVMPSSHGKESAGPGIEDVRLERLDEPKSRISHLNSPKSLPLRFGSPHSWAFPRAEPHPYVTAAVTGASSMVPAATSRSGKLSPSAAVQSLQQPAFGNPGYPAAGAALTPAVYVGMGSFPSARTGAHRTKSSDHPGATFLTGMLSPRARSGPLLTAVMPEVVACAPLGSTSPRADAVSPLWRGLLNPLSLVRCCQTQSPAPLYYVEGVAGRSA